MCSINPYYHHSHSLTHCCAWPAEGRSILHIERSWPAIQAAPTDRPTSSSTCCYNGWLWSSQSPIVFLIVYIDTVLLRNRCTHLTSFAVKFSQTSSVVSYRRIDSFYRSVLVSIIIIVIISVIYAMDKTMQELHWYGIKIAIRTAFFCHYKNLPVNEQNDVM